MVSVLSVTYSLGKAVDLKKARKAGLQQLDGDGNLLYTTVGSLFVVLFADGRLRISSADRSEESLRRELPLRGMELKRIVAAIAKSAALKVDADDVFSKAVDERDIALPRTLAGDFVNASVTRAISAATDRIMGAYHRERLETQAGETAGRKFGSKAKSRKELEQAIVRMLKEEGLGITSLGKAEAEKTGRTPYAVFQVLQSAFAYGAVPDGSALCHYIRGLIRGAYCAYLSQENVNVVECRCWGLGDVFCEFRVYII